MSWMLLSAYTQVIWQTPSWILVFLSRKKRLILKVILMYVHLSTRNYPTRLNSPTNQGKENWNIQFEFHGALDDQLKPKNLAK